MGPATGATSDFVFGEGEMAGLIRAIDWSASPLGSVEHWPQSLRTTVSLALASNVPINIIWGPQHLQIYNDGYRRICGDAHPHALGQPYTRTWASAWQVVGRPFEAGLAGETTVLENQPMVLLRNGHPEEALFSFSFSPIRDESGSVGGLFHPVTEIATAHGRAVMNPTEQRLELALDAGRLGSWDYDLETGRVIASDYCRFNFGVGLTDPFDRYEDVVARVHPKDREMRQQALDRAVLTGADLEIEHRVMRRDGQIGWLLVRGRAVYQGGRAVRISGVSLDITDRRKNDDRQRLLLDELNHRVKNTLATVQSIAAQTRRFASDQAEFDLHFFARVQALAQAHDLLTEASWEGASLVDVIARTLAPHLGAREADRVSLQGPGVRLGPNAAVTLNMAFHELATNAAKYGSLSVEGGRVDVNWRALGGARPNAIEIHWRESGGPAVEAPARRGFGSRLIEQGLARELAGETELVFDGGGLSCRMRFPLSAKLELAA